EVTRLSDSGTIVGDDSSDFVQLADSFSYSIPNQSLVSFAPSGPANGGTPLSRPFDVNTSGQIVGERTVFTSNSSTTFGYFYSGGVLTDLNIPGASLTAAEGITSSGAIVGFFTDGTGDHGFIDTPGTVSVVAFPFDVPAAWDGHD